MMPQRNDYNNKDRLRRTGLVILTVFAVFVIACTVYGLWKRMDSVRHVPFKCTNGKCLLETSRPLTVDEVYPAPCPACDQKTLLPAFPCPECGAINIWNEDRGGEPPTICHQCQHECYHGR
jgi:hypothetical protein